MEKKKLTKDSVSSWPVYLPNGMSTAEFEWWLSQNGFTVNHTSEKQDDGTYIYRDIWVRKGGNVFGDLRNFYSSEEEPSMRQILLNVGQQCGTSNNPVSIEAYNLFARWDVWPGGYVERLGNVGTPVNSAGVYGCSIFTSSWIRRGAAENPVHVFQFYQLVQDGRWEGGEVSTWGVVSKATKVLGSSTSDGFEPVPAGKETFGSLANLSSLLGYSGGIGGMEDTFADCHVGNGKYEVSDFKLYNYIKQHYYLKYIYANDDLDKVKEDINKHKAILLRVVTREDPSGFLYGNDYVVVDYNWLRQTFVCVNPVTGRLTSVSELEINSGTPKVRFYVVSKD